MKIKYSLTSLFCSTIFLISISALGQVGIGTTTPQGSLDINSSTTGLIYPVVELVDINTHTLNNPSGTNIVAGTTVYNSNTTSLGVNSVSPGIYLWDGAKWVPQFQKRDFMVYNQNADVRTDFISRTIDFNSQIFTPKYSGSYIITITAHFGGGQVRDPNNQNTPFGQYINFAAEKGNFTFNLTGLPSRTFGVYSYSAKNNERSVVGVNSNNRKNYNNAYNQTNYTFEVTLQAGTPYTFGLNFLQNSDIKFENDGNFLDGRGFILRNGIVNCRLEFNYTGE